MVAIVTQRHNGNIPMKTNDAALPAVRAPGGQRPEVRPALRIVLTYLVFAALWIYLSGWGLSHLTADPEVMNRWETYKGWAFVTVTAALLYYLLNRTLARIRQAQSSLEQSETRLRLALASAHQGLYDFNLPTGEAVTNEEYALMLGYCPDDFRETIDRWMDRLHPDDHARVTAAFQECVAGRIEEYRLEFRHRTREGDWKWILCLGRAVARDDQSQALRLLGTHTDITPQKQAEYRVRKLNHLHEVLRLTNETIERHGDRDTLFRETCGNAVKHGALQMAWIGTIDPLHNQLVPVAACGIPAEYRAELTMPMDTSASAHHNPLGQALHQGTHYVCQELKDTASRDPWCIAALQAGCHSAAAFPLKQKGLVLGALCLLATEADFFDHEATALLDEMARDVSLALDNLEVEAQRTQALAALQASEAKFRRIVETANEGICLLDEHFELTFVNRRMAEMLGYTEAEILHHPAEEFLLPEELRDHQAQIAARRQGASGHYERRLRRKDGATVWALISATPIRDERQEFRGSFAMLTDITQRKQALDALCDSEARFRQLFADNPLPMWVASVETLRFLEVNDAALAHYGYARAEFLELHFSDLYRTESVPPLRQFLKAWDGKQAHLDEVQHRLKNGRLIWVEVALHGCDFAGQRAVLVASVDITERKRALQALHKLSGRLLRLQDEERRRIARELHDTTTQDLAALSMNLSLLQPGLPKGDPRWEQLLADCARLAAKSTQEIRTLSYLLHPPMLEVLGLPGAVRELVEGFARRSGIKTEFDAPKDFGRLPADVETALFRVVQESLGNIHRHSGSPTARIQLRRHNGQLTVEIADTGGGIPPEKLAGLANGTSALGVGIAGMRERLHQLGGKLDVASGSAGTRVKAVVPLNLRTSDE